MFKKPHVQGRKPGTTFMKGNTIIIHFAHTLKRKVIYIYEPHGIAILGTSSTISDNDNLKATKKKEKKQNKIPA